MTLPVGMIMPFAGIEAPTGWLKCDGSEVSRTEYADLFAAIGTLYGDGNKVTTFNLPNLVGKYIGGDSDTHTVGSTSNPQAQNIKSQIDFSVPYGSGWNDAILFSTNASGSMTSSYVQNGSRQVDSSTYQGRRYTWQWNAANKSLDETDDPIYKAGLIGDDRLRPATVYMSYMIKC